jgi:hypothetical protein
MSVYRQPEEMLKFPAERERSGAGGWVQLVYSRLKLEISQFRACLTVTTRRVVNFCHTLYPINPDVLFSRSAGLATVVVQSDC